MNTSSDTISSSVKNWWWFIMKGLLLITAGIVILVRSAEGYAGLSILFSMLILGVGLTQIFFSITRSDVLNRWRWTFASGIIDVIIGIYLLSYPIITMVTLPYVVGFWLIFRAFYLMGPSFDLETLGVPRWGWLLAGGILLVILAFAILYYPAAGLVSVVAYSASAFFAAAIFNIILALKFKSIYKDVKGFEGRLKHATELQ